MRRFLDAMDCSGSQKNVLPDKWDMIPEERLGNGQVTLGTPPSLRTWQIDPEKKKRILACRQLTQHLATGCQSWPDPAKLRDSLSVFNLLWKRSHISPQRAFWLIVLLVVMTQSRGEGVRNQTARRAQLVGVCVSDLIPGSGFFPVLSGRLDKMARRCSAQSSVWNKSQGPGTCLSYPSVLHGHGNVMDSSCMWKTTDRLFLGLLCSIGHTELLRKPKALKHTYGP